MSIQLMMEYRFNFFMTTWTIGLWLVSYTIWVALLYQFTDSIQGYSELQYMAFVGFYFLVINLFWFLFDYGIHDLSDAIYEGRIDFLMIKPIDGQFALSFKGFHMPSFFNMIFGLLVIVYAMGKGGTVVSVTQLISLTIVMLISVISLYSIMFTILSLTFWAGRLHALQTLLSKVIDDPATVPGTAYKGIVKVFFYFVIPVVLVSTIPTEILFWHVSRSTVLFYAFFAAIVFMLSRTIWKLGLRSYTSVSS